MLIAIVGSRNFLNLDLVAETVRDLSDDDIVISGGARGVDRTAEQEAIKCGLGWISLRPVEFETMWNTKEFCIEPEISDNIARHWYAIKEMWKITQPTWRTFRDAAFARNEVIIKSADVVVAGWDGKSNGTRNALDWAKRYRKPIMLL